MIFLHIILGLILGKITSAYLPFILGSLLPDLDHIYVIIKHKLHRRNFLDTLKNEEKYNIKYKTPLFHSILGLIIFTAIFYLITNNQSSSIYFASAYFLHLLMDWPDKDIKYYLYPLKTKFSGFLPIWSKTEKILTILAIIILLMILLI